MKAAPAIPDSGLLKRQMRGRRQRGEPNRSLAWQLSDSRRQAGCQPGWKSRDFQPVV